MRPPKRCPVEVVNGGSVILTEATHRVLEANINGTI